MESEKKEKVGKRKFSDEFKLEAVELANKLGASKAGRDLGINESLIRSWSKTLKKVSIGASEKKSYEELERENRRLAKEIQYIKEINEVLKKSTAIFSAGHMGGLK